MAMEFVGKIVEIDGLTKALDEDAYLRDAGSHGALIPNGKHGRAMAFDANTGKFAVETFDGLLLAIASENLKEWKPPPSDQGGFDVTWPSDESEFVAFAPTVCQSLRDKDYCVVQMYMGDRQRSKAMEETEDLAFIRMKTELEQAYVGRKKESKVCWMGGITDPDAEAQSAMQACDQFFGTFCQLVEPLTHPALGFNAECRTNSMARMPLGNSSVRQEELSEEDIEDGLVDSHISFCRRRKLCMLMVVESAGAELSFIPQDENAEIVNLSVEKGQFIIFNHAKLSYAYQPSSTEDLILQSWMLAVPPPTALQAVHADAAAKDAASGLFDGPKTPFGGVNRICVMSLTPGLPGGAHDSAEKWWSLLAPGCDAYVRAPKERFDIDPYFLPNEEWRLGFTYACHAGFVNEDIYSFDNQFFGVPDDEAFIFNPALRKCFEHGYSCLYLAGYTMKTLGDGNLGTYVGNSGDDWQSGVFSRGNRECNRKQLAHRSLSFEWQQVPFYFGMKGPSIVVDTACSSALVGYNIAHTDIRRIEKGQTASGCEVGLTGALCIGCNLIPGPGNFIGLSGPHMLSPTGRCYTFNLSADGFARGEGTGAFTVKSQNFVSDDSIAVMIGACTNQDGRSASLTAPNGPSQSACIKASMKEAGNSPNEITCAECHGTGTALGDPIEVGALRGIMGDRELPLMESSAKAHIGHLEAGAGMAGVLKCISMNQACAGSPSPHLSELNPNLDINGYPTIFCTELVPYGGNSGNTGVSSFGWGGANARADVWAPCQLGANKINKAAANVASKYVDYMEATCPIDDGPMYHLDGKAIPSEFSPDFKIGTHTADTIRDEFDAYDYSVYDGKYQYAPEEKESDVKPPDGPICIVGSWTAHSTMQEMELDEETDVYSFVVPLGETRCETFHMVLDKSPDQLNIYPVADKGSMLTRVLGPETGGEDKKWLLDGRDEEVPSGTLYKINLHWGEKLKVTWERLTEEGAAPTVVSDYVHSYQLIGSFSGMSTIDLAPVKGTIGLFEARVKITGKEWFYLTRDYDESQRIYPGPEADGVTPARGPDEFGGGKHFRVENSKFEEVITIKAKVLDGHVTVEVVQPSGTTTWESIEGPKRTSYQVNGTWDQSPTLMTPDPATIGVYTCTGVMKSEQESFTIIVDEDARFQLYPEVSSSPGTCVCKGPDAGSPDTMFQLVALKPGASFEIKLDLKAKNKKEKVTVKWLTEPVDIESMQAYATRYLMA